MQQDAIALHSCRMTSSKYRDANGNSCTLVFTREPQKSWILSAYPSQMNDNTCKSPQPHRRMRHSMDLRKRALLKCHTSFLRCARYLFDKEFAFLKYSTAYQGGTIWVREEPGWRERAWQLILHQRVGILPCGVEAVAQPVRCSTLICHHSHHLQPFLPYTSNGLSPTTQISNLWILRTLEIT